MKSLISDESKYKIKNTVGTIFSIIVAFILLYLTFKDVNLTETFEIILNSSAGYLILFILSFFLSHVLRSLRWQVILRSIKPNTSFLNTFSSIMIGYGVNCAVPRLGELYRSLFAGRLENISRSSMLGTIIVERIIDLIFLALSVFVSVIIYSGDLYTQILWLKSTLLYGSIILLGIVLILLLIIKNKDSFISKLIKVFSFISPKLSSKINYILNMLIEGFATLNNTKNFLLTMFYSVMIMIVYGLTSYLAFFVLRFNINYNVTYEMGWIVMTLSAFGIVIPTPGGTGSYHLIVKSILEILYGFSVTESSAFALMTHSFSYIAFISSMFILLKIVNIDRAKRNLKKVTFISVIKSRWEKNEII